ncbi:MAG: hypothetical protein QM691_06045 [Opitutaceae bacterium]
MSRPASLTRFTGSLTCLALLVGGTSLSAQQKTPIDEKKTESEEAIFIPIEYRPPPWQVSVGVRLSGKAKVKFSGLGAVPAQTYTGPNPNATAEEKSTQAYKDAVAYVAQYGRVYDDGAVRPDSTYKISSDQNATTTTYERVEPADGKTNYWSFTSVDQVVDYNGSKALALNSYSVVSTGGAEAERTASTNKSLAWDIEFSRALGTSRRMSWGLILGAGISDINCTASSTVKAKLRTVTDYYSLDGVTFSTSTDGTIVIPTAAGSTEYYPYTWKLTDDGSAYAVDADGNKIPVYQYDADGNKIKAWPEVLRLLADPIARTEATEETGTLDVVGQWQVKGAYMTARFGPYFAFQLTPRLTLKASAGITFTVIGYNLRLNEQVYIPALKAYMSLDNEKLNLDPGVSGILGYFASCELDAYLTDRTGVFFGASQEDFQRDITMSYYTQRADLSLSTGTVFRTGITTRF